METECVSLKTFVYVLFLQFVFIYILWDNYKDLKKTVQEMDRKIFEIECKYIKNDRYK